MTRKTWRPTPAAKRREVYLKSGGSCWYCGDDLDPSGFDIDHFDNEGSDTIENLVPSCHPCNCSKRDRGIEHFRRIKARKTLGTPVFTEEQRRWLIDNGFAFPEPEPYTFWFEEQEMQG